MVNAAMIDRRMTADTMTVVEKESPIATRMDPSAKITMHTMNTDSSLAQ